MKTGSYTEQRLQKIIDADGTVPEDVASAYVAWANNLAPAAQVSFPPSYHIQAAEETDDVGGKAMQLVWAAHSLLSDGCFPQRVETVRTLLSQAAEYRGAHGNYQQQEELEVLAKGAEHVVRIGAAYQAKYFARPVLNFSDPAWH